MVLTLNCHLYIIGVVVAHLTNKGKGNIMLTQLELKELLHYCPETGIFTRISSPRKRRIGVIKTCSNNGDGYFQIFLLGNMYLAHRLAWLYTNGSWPKAQIDHINMDRIDNRLSNLREATYVENQRNRGVRRDNMSGFKGVSFHKPMEKWRAQICINSKPKYLGFFTSPELASEAYEAAAKVIHGEFYYLAAK